MTDYSISYWFKNPGLERLYVNADDRSALGYIERRQVERARGVSGHYNRHRAAKGDTMEVVSDRITCTLPNGAYEALIAQAVAAADAAGLNHGKVNAASAGGEVGCYLDLKNILTGNGYLVDQPKVRKARKKLAESFRFVW